METCSKCGRERPTTIAEPTCSVGGYCDWLDEHSKRLHRQAEAFGRRAHELARFYVDQYAGSRERIDRLNEFDPKLAEHIRELTACSIASLWRDGYVKLPPATGGKGV